MVFKESFMRKNILMIIIVIFMALGYSELFQNKESIANKEQKIKEILDAANLAPDFTLDALNDTSYTLSKLQGKVVLINFWATWCAPCRMEIPDFNEVYKEHMEDLEILGISISDNQKTLENFVKVFPIDYPVLYGKSRKMDKVLRNYGGVYAVPTSVLIGRSGDLLNTYPGALLKGHPLYTKFLQDLESAIKQ